MSKTIYIAGAVTGLNVTATAEKFAAKERELVALGHTVINPVREVQAAGIGHKSWQEIMRYCIAKMMKADEVHLLHCWHSSTGANVERDTALRVKIPVVYP